MKRNLNIQRTAVWLVLLLAGWALGSPLSAQTVVDITPDLETNVFVRNDGSNQIDSLVNQEYGLTFAFSVGEGRNVPIFHQSTSAIRCYSGNTISVTSPNHISQIDFTVAAYKTTDSTLVAQSGKVVCNEATTLFTWTNTDAVANPQFSIINTVTNQFRITGIKVTLTDSVEENLKAPVLSQKSCDFYQNFDRTITDLNSPAATIKYTLDGSTPSATNGNTYTAPVTINAGSDVTVKAVAVSGDKVSQVTSATYHYVAKYLLSLRSSNKNALSLSNCYFSSSSEYGYFSNPGDFYISEGEEVYVSLYTNSSYSIKGVKVNSTDVELQASYSGCSFRFTMPAKAAEIVVDAAFEPSSPGDPEPMPVDTTSYFYLTTVSNPTSAYSFGEPTKVAGGSNVYLYAYENSGYIFTGWSINGITASTNRSLTIAMPYSDLVVTANYVYNPSSPSDPEQPTLKHPLTVTASPQNSATFSTTGSEVTFGEEYYVRAYPRDGYKLKGWIVNGVAIETTDVEYRGIMTEMGAQIVALLYFDPSSPSNPGANNYNAVTGQLILDDFRQGSLSSAISNIIAYENYGNVSSVIVKGKMNTSDYRSVRDFSNAATIDLSRVGGETTLPSYAFQNMAASSILLPSTITEIGSYAFSGCANLTSLTLYAQEPPVCSSYSFYNFTNKENCTVFVPASAVALYTEAEYWKDFTILPIGDDAHILQVNLPEDASDGRYKFYSLEIVNISSGVRQKYVVSDRLLYTFNGLRKDEQYNVYLISQSGLEVGRIDAVTIPDGDIAVTFDNIKTLHTITAKVIGIDNADLTNQVTVEWFKPLDDGTTSYLRKAAYISEIPEGQQLVCRVTLDSKLGVIYLEPDDATVTAGETDNTCTINLAAIRTITISGEVVDADGAPLQGVAVSISQIINGKYQKTYLAKTDKAGKWSADVLDATSTSITFAAPECVNVKLDLPPLGDVTKFDAGKTPMRSIVGARINYGFTYQAAGVDTVGVGYADYNNVLISVFNITQNRAHNEVSLQYPVLAVLDENIAVNDQLRLTATSKTGAFNPIEKTVTIGENQRADVIFDIVGKGGIKASFEMTDNPAVNAMLYSANGELVKKAQYANAEVTFTELEDGSYTLVSMGNSDLMNSVLRLSNFVEIGLTEGRDYVKNAVVVERGKLALVNNAEIPAFDESLFYYTNTSTSFTANKSSITTGNYLTLRAVVDFKGVYKDQISNVALVVDLPEACDFVEQSVIQGPNLLPYTLDNKRLTIQLGKYYTSQTRFCVIPTVAGAFTATASIVFDYNGKTVTQPIGAVSTEVKSLEIVVPNSTANGSFRVIGKAESNSAVSIFVDGVLNAQARANGNGDWNATCQLTEPENYSEHTVYVEFTKESRPTLVSETKTILYNPYDVRVNSVEMTFWNGWYKKQYNVIWDFIAGSVNCNKYDFYHATDMTFLIDISYRDKKLLPFVWLYVYTSDNNVRVLRAEYNESKDRWIASDKFNSSALPTRVAVRIENMMFDISSEVDFNLLIDDFVTTVNVVTNKPEADGGYKYTDKNDDEILNINPGHLELTPEECIDYFENKGFVIDSNISDVDGYIPVDENDKVDEGTVVMINWSTSTIVILSRDGYYVSIEIRHTESWTSLEYVARLSVKYWLEYFRTYFDPLACAQVTEYKEYTEHLEEYAVIMTTVLISQRIFADVNLWTGDFSFSSEKIIAVLRRIVHSIKRYTSYTIEKSVLPLNCTPEPPAPEPAPVPDVHPILDPSGYVYEAVPVNRVPGVQATIYYKETKYDMYGDPYEEVVVWNAEEYAQQNPLFTDEYGMYSWDVPQGLWQVQFEKDGYVTAYSEWLPVPPPQLDVNVGITQNKQPEVLEARAYEEGIEIQFDKYMDMSTLSADNIYVTSQGNKLDGTIEYLDAALADEYATEEDTDALRYASRVRFVPSTSIAATAGEIRLTVSRNVRSYAGIPMAETYSQVLDVEKEVQMISAEVDNVKVLYGGEKEVTIYALPFDAAVGRTLHIANSSDLIASVDVTEATFDEEGKAVIKVKGELPGCSQLTFTIDDVTVTGTCAIDVVTQIVTAEAPKASRATGTAVYRGTKVELTTDTKDAVIYFTTDGSCPCDEEGTRRKYSVPFVVNEDTNILAITVAGDDESDVVEFNYTIKKSDIDFRMAQGWTWISHSFDNELAASQLTAEDGIDRILSQTKEVIRDPQLGWVGNLTTLNASESYKVEASAATSLQRLNDVAWNPATPISVAAGWNWLGYPVTQTMSVDEALASTEVETGDVIVGQEGFAQYDGDKWVGTLATMTPGAGYMYQSVSAKSVVYNTAIVSKAAAIHAVGISNNNGLVLDIHKYGFIMPVIASITSLDGATLDANDYQVAAFCGSECRGIGRVIDGLVMMNVYGNANDRITFSVTDAEGEMMFATTAAITFREVVVGDLNAPYAIAIDGLSGVYGVKYDGNVRVAVVGDMLRITGIAADDIELVEVYDINGQKLIRETVVSESGIRLSTLATGVYVVIVNGNGEYTYHKVAVR